ncbi:SRPBCC family protein [uncultured Tateyamaria sp.]|uniref:SRPBCC family protein n=1 Tax=uncultured Tateyamaria sp. TaxID=455651 RepID=UPI00260AE5B2|nr:SRPBCC family protein [uncultured Tateyamaria sp.]
MFIRSTIAAIALSTPLATAALAGTGVAMAFPSITFAETVADIPPAPALSPKSRYLTNTETATFNGTIDGFRAFLDANPITDFVVPTDAIPAIEGITYLSGTWPNPGALRRVDLAGGHSVHEQVVANTDTNFVYQIWNITAPAGRAINHIKGEFTFAQSGDEVTVTWDYNIKPNVFFARPAIRGFLDNDFGPFMQAGLTGLVAAYER